MRIIAHLDLDAFFASVEERDHEWLRGLPIVVGADPKGGKGRGVVSTANYKAREYGIRSAMPISEAWRRSEEARKRGKPAAVFVGTDFGRYEEISTNIMKIVRNYAAVVEKAGIDEAYFDLSQVDSFSDAKQLCEKLKAEIKLKEKLTASIGIGPNKLVAKIASDLQKPDGLTVVEEKDAEAFLESLPIRKIPGIGPKTEMLLNQRGVRLVRDLKKLSRDELREMLGKLGLDLYAKARGIDDSPITEESEVKSIGEQETFPEDTKDVSFLLATLAKMCERTIRRFSAEGFKSFRTVSIMVRFSDFETKTRARTLPSPQNSLKVLRAEVLKLFLPFLDRRENPKRKLLRLIGVRIEKLQ